MTALFEKVVVSLASPGQAHPEPIDLRKETLDNRWHWVALRYRQTPPALMLEVDQESMVRMYIVPFNKKNIFLLLF